MNGIERGLMIRAYCDYVEEHLLNVQTAWKLLRDALDAKGERVIYDDFFYTTTDAMIVEHDKSKFSKEELVPYAEWFIGPQFGLERTPEREGAFQAAWEHHKAHNPHHWETWTTTMLRKAQ